VEISEDTPLFVISVAAELAGMHPQTLRQYDRLGLVSPTRTSGKSRRYTMQDVVKLRDEGTGSRSGARAREPSNEPARKPRVCRWRSRSNKTKSGSAPRALRVSGLVEEKINESTTTTRRAKKCTRAVRH